MADNLRTDIIVAGGTGPTGMIAALARPRRFFRGARRPCSAPRLPAASTALDAAGAQLSRHARRAGPRRRRSRAASLAASSMPPPGW